MIGALRKIAAARNAYVIFVQADLEDAPAIALYESLGTKETHRSARIAGKTESTTSLAISSGAVRRQQVVHAPRWSLGAIRPVQHSGQSRRIDARATSAACPLRLR